MADISGTIWQVALAVIMGGIGLFIMFKLAQISNAQQGIVFNATTSVWSNASNLSQPLTSYGPMANWSIFGMFEFTDNISLIGLVLVIGLIAVVVMKAKLFA